MLISILKEQGPVKHGEMYVGAISMKDCTLAPLCVKSDP